MILKSSPEAEIGPEQLYGRARHYDPTIGRFISEDPIGFEGGDENLYRYVGNGPTNATDPSGLIIKGVIPGFPSGGFYINTNSGNTYSGWTSQELLDALNQVKANQDTINDLYLKGHGNGQSISDWNGNPFCEVTLDDDGNPRNRNKIRMDLDESGRNVNILDLLKCTTNNGSTIHLNGCSTGNLASNMADMLGNGTTVVGHPTGIINIPGTYTWYVGPWWSYNTQPE